MYIGASSLINSWSISVSKVKYLCDQYYREGLKYQCTQPEAYKELIEKRTKLYSSYSKATKALSEKKEQSYAKGNISEWKMNKEISSMIKEGELLSQKSLALSLMYEKETDEVLEKYKVYAYYTNKLYENTQRLFRYDIESIASSIIKFIIEMREVYSKQINFMNSQESTFIELIEKSQSEFKAL
jgi:hypothetical protein